MLVLTRKIGENILIGDGVVVTVRDMRGGRVRLSIEAPSDVLVLRGELVGRRPGPKEWDDPIEVFGAHEAANPESPYRDSRMNVTRTDPAADPLANRAAAVLRRRWGRCVRDFRVEMLQGGLVLYGRAADYYSKQVAQHAAAEAVGLPVLVNAIEVG